MAHGKKAVFRKNWLIYPRFQLLLIALNTLIVSAAFSLVVFQTHSFFDQLKKTGTDSGLTENQYYFIFLGNQATKIYGMIFFAWIGAILLSGILSLLVSHKIVGPIMRLKSYFREISETSEIRPLSFRKGDFFSDLPDAVNRALGTRHQ